MPGAARRRRGCERDDQPRGRSPRGRRPSPSSSSRRRATRRPRCSTTRSRGSRRFRPSYVSVTYGAGGTSQERSLGTVRRMQRIGLRDRRASHLRRREPRRRSRETIGGSAKWASSASWRCAAIRPAGSPSPTSRIRSAIATRRSSCETLKRAGATEVSVSAYPERHPQSADWDAEIGALKRKVDAGADRAITQFFFDNDLFEAYRRARPPRRHRISRSCPASCRSTASRRSAASPAAAARAIPAELARRFDGLDPDQETHALVAAAVAAEQMADLDAARRRRVPHLHAEPRRADGSDLPDLRRRLAAMRDAPPPESGGRTRDRRLAAAGRWRQNTPKTIAPRKTKAAQTAMKFSGLMKVIGWPPSASRGAY